MKPPLLALAHAAALWPVWRWYASRVVADREYAGLAALGAIALLVARRSDAPPARGAPLWPAAALLLACAALFPWLPPLGRAGLGFLSLASLLGALRLGRAFDPGLWGLALLALPVMPTVQFYAGYPLRALVATASAWLLNAMGLAVSRAGATLDWAGTSVLVDGPCSGVKMLWAAGLLACWLAASRGLGARRSVEVGLAALAAVLFANVLRATSLFFLEAGVLALGPAASLAHEAVGVAAFAFAAAAILACVELGEGREESCA